jgi:DNA-binding MarR family transcriptional regulator
MTQPDRKADEIFDAVSIPIAYKIGYLSNNYREPSFRAIESKYAISRPEILVLIFLAVVDGSTATEICELSGHLKTNISRAVMALEKKKLIRRLPSADDLRRQHLYLTARGRELHQKFMPTLNARETAMTGCLTQGEYAMFRELLAKLCRHVPNWNGDSHEE